MESMINLAGRVWCPHLVSVIRPRTSSRSRGNSPKLSPALRWDYTEASIQPQCRQLFRLYRRGGIPSTSRTPHRRAGYTSKPPTPPTPQLAFIAAKPNSQVLRNINDLSTSQAARALIQHVTTTYLQPATWVPCPVKEAERTTSLAYQGEVDVDLHCHVDVPIVIWRRPTAAAISVAGFHLQPRRLLLQGHLTGAEWNWSDGLHDT